MARLPKPLITLLAALTAVALVAGACSSTPAASKLTDPNQIMTQAFDNAAKAKSFHVTAAASGQFTGDVGIPGVGGANGGSLKIDGATLEGDVNVAGEAAHLSFNVPTALLSGDVIVVDKTLYAKATLLGDKYQKLPLSDLSSLAPMPLPSPSAIPTGDLQQQLKDAGVTPTLEGTSQIAGAEAYHIALAIPVSKINQLITSDGGSLASGLTLDSASVDLWVYVNDVLPAQVEIKGSSASMGNVDLTVTFTNYDKSVTISAPPASEIQ